MIDRLTLSSEHELLVQEWVENLKPVLDKHDLLSTVDLIVEGGVGNGTSLSCIISRLFPQVLYIGTDLSCVEDKHRLSGAIDNASLETIIKANQVEFDQRSATINADCFDPDLIYDIMRKTDHTQPLLVSFNALFALSDKKANPWQSKQEKDIHSKSSMLTETPYVAQLHITSSIYPWGDQGLATQTFLQLRDEALRNEFITEEIDCGLLVVKPKIS